MWSVDDESTQAEANFQLSPDQLQHALDTRLAGNR
jgi:hypothetical protein